MLLKRLMVILTPPSPQSQPTQYVNYMEQRRETCPILLRGNQLNLPHLFTCGLFKAPRWSSHFSWLRAHAGRFSVILWIDFLFPEPACPGNLLILLSDQAFACSRLAEFFAEDYQPLGLFLGIFF